MLLLKYFYIEGGGSYVSFKNEVYVYKIQDGNEPDKLISMHESSLSFARYASYLRYLQHDI